MIGVAIALRARSRFLIAAAITAAACLGAITLDCAAAQGLRKSTHGRRPSDADRDADKRRDPAPFLAFAAPRPGMKVLDMGAGGGYSSELMARAVAPNGIVFAQTPANLGDRAKAAFEARLATAAMKNAVAEIAPFDDPVPAARRTSISLPSCSTTTTRPTWRSTARR